MIVLIALLGCILISPILTVVVLIFLIAGMALCVNSKPSKNKYATNQMLTINTKPAISPEWYAKVGKK